MSTSSRPSPLVAERKQHPFLTYDMIYEIPEAIERTIQACTPRMESIAGRLEGKSHFYFTGCGTAFFSATLGSNIFSLSGADAPGFEAVQALELTNHHRVAANSAAFGVSHSGITKTTLDALRKSKSAGGYTVGITHFADSPISRVADETLVVGNSPDKSRCHTKCYLTGALPITILGASLLERQNASDPERLRKIRSELGELPHLAKKVLTSADLVIKELAEKNAFKRTFYFAGSGASYPNAVEAALKIMETSYVPAQGFETEQLLHGPWASLDNDSVVFVMATENRTHSRSIDLVKAAANLGSTVVLLTYEGDREIDSVGNIGIELPMVDEQLAPFLSIIPLYLFAYYTAVKRGHNPDYLRYLTPTYWDARTIIFPAGTH